ncbi:MAG TPA: cyclic nucleotide-binding domain-containing protein [Burkholderiales bacterium]|nr:cyclic nucleotide-binding domain-containing protein [Burkholderiales bacterium]
MAATRTGRKPATKPALRMSALLGLQKVDLFKGLDSYTLREIAAQCKWTRCKRNQVVIHHDGADRDVYFVIAGQVRVTAQAGRGRHIIFRELAAGEVFGEHSAIDGRARFADALALRETLLASMSPEAFRAVLANHASVRERLLRRLTGSVRDLAGRLLDLGAQPVQRRAWVELLRLARVAGIVENRARLDPAPTHNDIASRVGTSREQITRELSRLVREGLLERAGRGLVLLDVAALERLAGDVRPEADAGAGPAVQEPRAFHGVTSPRQRRAILMAEMSDSIALMERDEERTVERCRTFLAHATSQIVPTHAGRSMLKVPADGFIAEFPDAAQALRCAFELHADLARFNTHRDAAPLGLRAGIHVAEVIVEAFNVLGDGVNLAAGLAELANPGETVVSTQARDQLTSGVDASVEDLGEQRLRNRSRAVRAFRAWPPAQTRVWTPNAAVQAHGRPSVAVIPFQLRSDDARFDSIGDSLADDVIAALSRMADFFVISRLSTMAFRRAPIGVRRIGEMLGVQYVLSGSVQTAYPRALLMAELADARDGRIVWSQRFQGDLADIFAMQGELARKVVHSVAPFVRSLELQRARITNFEQLDAYAITLRGVELMHRVSHDDFMQARTAFETAIARDPVSPRPHAWLAKWHVLRVLIGMSGDPAGDMDAATACAEHALGCDANDALALAVDAFVAAWSRHDLDAAEQRLTQALTANPNEPLAWLHSGITHAWRGRGSEAIECTERALSLSPLDPMIYYFEALAGMANLIGERYERAIELSTQSLRENRLHTPSLRTLAAAQVCLGRLAEARQTMSMLRELEPALTGSALRARYPGRDSPQADRFIGALLTAGLPA